MSEPPVPVTRTARVAAVLAATGFASLALFQAALAAGATWGHAAWGGENAHLPSAQRSASAGAAVLYAVAAGIVLGRAGIIWRAWSDRAVFRSGTWALAVAMALGALPNLVSQSRWDNLIFAPLALVLAALCLVLARTAPGRRRPDRSRQRGHESALG